jgi:NADH dehydrogenase
LIAFSSNNVAVHAEIETYAGIAEAEAQLRQRFPNVIIVRPTLIYGDPRLPTLPRLMSIARTWPIMPLPGTGRANLQPVFHEDLAYVVAGLMKEDTQGGVYAVGGPEVLTMRELFDAVQVAVGVRRPVISIRGAPLEFMARMRLFGFSPEQAARADRNRTAVPQAPLPPALCPRTRMQDGLARLAVALGYRE